jgi:hypothetical protein
LTLASDLEAPMLERPSDPFEHALDEARRAGRRADDELAAGTPLPRVRASVDLGPTIGAGGEARFGLAMDWAGEPMDPPKQEATTSCCPGTQAEIAAELGLGGALTLGQLMSRWRDFVWRNHPDRQPSHLRERANARVAIANALYHKMRSELKKER